MNITLIQYIDLYNDYEPITVEFNYQLEFRCKKWVSDTFLKSIDNNLATAFNKYLEVLSIRKRKPDYLTNSQNFYRRRIVH